MDFDSAKEKAVRYLVVAKRTEKEVREKLKKLKCTDNIIDKVVEYLINLGYINDEEYIDAYIRQSMRLLSLSIFEIKKKLLQKGINKSLINERLENVIDINYEKMLIEKLMNTKLKNIDVLKRKQYLYRRGFRNLNEINYLEE